MKERELKVENSTDPVVSSLIVIACIVLYTHIGFWALPILFGGLLLFNISVEYTVTKNINMSEDNNNCNE